MHYQGGVLTVTEVRNNLWQTLTEQMVDEVGSRGDNVCVHHTGTPKTATAQSTAQRIGQQLGAQEPGCEPTIYLRFLGTDWASSPVSRPVCLIIINEDRVE